MRIYDKVSASDTRMIAPVHLKQKSILITAAIGVILFITVVLIQTKSGNELIMKIDSLQTLQKAQVSTATTTRNDAKFLDQRNMLSKHLNEMKRLYGQQSCNMMALQAKAGGQVDARISANGGWCAQTSGTNSSSHVWDQGLSKALSTFLKGKSVASFGDGPGLYKKHLDSVGEVKSYTAYDGAPFCESTTEGRVKFLDLTAPQFGMPAFDWVVSIEVGEHIPAKFEDIFLDNLARHAKEGIILSWAVPGQGGLSHVNNKALTDVVNQMKKRHFSFNSDHGKPLRDASSFYWLKQNIHVYRRTDPSTFQEEDV